LHLFFIFSNFQVPITEKTFLAIHSQQ
jgi:hypothetical protein